MRGFLRQPGDAAATRTAPYETEGHRFDPVGRALRRDTARAMSGENVEIVRQVYEAAAGRDAASIFALYDPDVELDATRLGVGDLGVYRGHGGLRSLFGGLHEVWGEIEYDYEELIDAGEHVVAVVTRHARGRASGVDVEAPLALLWTVREGKVVKVVWFATREEALEAAGLSE
jgi:ketosteroid isomerase-like protein